MNFQVSERQLRGLDDNDDALEVKIPAAFRPSTDEDEYKPVVHYIDYNDGRIHRSDSNSTASSSDDDVKHFADGRMDFRPPADFGKKKYRHVDPFASDVATKTDDDEDEFVTEASIEICPVSEARPLDLKLRNPFPAGRQLTNRTLPDLTSGRDRLSPVPPPDVPGEVASLMPELSVDAPDGHAHVHTDQCAVCLDSELPVDMKLLPCNHTFHAKCIVRWVEKNYSCPLCRRSIDLFIPADHLGDAASDDFLSSEFLQAHQETANALARLTKVWEQQHRFTKPVERHVSDDDDGDDIVKKGGAPASAVATVADVADSLAMLSDEDLNDEHVELLRETIKAQFGVELHNQEVVYPAESIPFMVQCVLLKFQVMMGGNMDNQEAGDAAETKEESCLPPLPSDCLAVPNDTETVNLASPEHRSWKSPLARRLSQNLRETLTSFQRNGPMLPDGYDLSSNSNLGRPVHIHTRAQSAPVQNAADSLPRPAGLRTQSAANVRRALTAVPPSTLLGIMRQASGSLSSSDMSPVSVASMMSSSDSETAEREHARDAERHVQDEWSSPETSLSEAEVEAQTTVETAPPPPQTDRLENIKHAASGMVAGASAYRLTNLVRFPRMTVGATMAAGGFAAGFFTGYEFFKDSFRHARSANNQSNHPSMVEAGISAAAASGIADAVRNGMRNSLRVNPLVPLQFGVQFATFETVKAARLRSKGTQKAAWDDVALSMATGAGAASSAVHAMQYVQNAGNGSVVNGLKRAVSNPELLRPSAIVKGFGSTAARVMPTAVCTALVYEYASRMFGSDGGYKDMYDDE